MLRQAVCGLLFICVWPLALAAQSADTAKSITHGVRLLWENDTRLPWNANGTDRYYTNGLKLATDWVVGGKPLMLSIGQTMYTPAVITTEVPDPLDRPYAGFTSIGVARVSEEGLLELQVGALGRWSGADRVQRFWHEHVTGSPRPEGWEYGIPSEVGLVLRGERAFSLAFGDDDGSTNADAQLVGGLTIGNVFDQFMTRLGGRFGHNIPATWSSKIAPAVMVTRNASGETRSGWWSRNTSLYVLASVESRLVAYNATLDGPLFHSRPCQRQTGAQEGPCVNRNGTVADFEGGIGGRLWHLEAVYRRVIRTSEFVGGRTQRFNAGSIGWVW